MRILLLTTHLEMGGIPIYVIQLAKGLKAMGHFPTVVSSGGSLVGRLEEEGIVHREIPCRTSSELNPKLWLLAFPKLLSIIRRGKPDLLHAHTRVTQILSWAASTLTRIPYMTTCHGLYKLRIGRRLFRCWGRAVTAISQASMERLVVDYRLAPPHRAVLIRNGIETDRFRQPPPPDAVNSFKEALGLTGRPVLGAIARLSPVKGLHGVLETIPSLLKDHPNLQLLLVGDGPQREELIRASYALKVADHVVICHPVEDTRIPLAAMDIFLAPSFREGFGLAIVEAMAAGVPVVATNNGGPAEIIEEGKSGLLVPPGKPRLLEEAIRKLLADSAWRARISEEGRKQVCERFDMKRVVREMVQVYERVAA